MKPRFPRFAPLFLLLTWMLVVMPLPVGAQAGITISPSTVTSGVATVITITGTGFNNSASVFLDGTALTGAVYDGANTLSVSIPADVTLGSHVITVSVDGVSVGSATLNVTEPAPTATSAPAPVVRPQIAVENYRTKPENVQYGQEFTLIVKLRNEGEAQAFNVQATFASSSFLPLRNGGVNIVGDLGANNSKDVDQAMTASSYVYGIVSVDMTLSYNDASGTAYTEKFTLNIRASGGSGVAAATATPTGVKSSQLVITSYASSVDPLQPGEQFKLTMTIQNTGNVRAQRVTMIVGGGSSSGSSDGTPQPGGVSGGSGEFTNFAPVGASNVQTLGDLPEGGMVQASQDLIVNVSTNPGAYPMKVTFSYLNDKGEAINDEQVITLLVYGLPSVDISFYRPPDPFFVGQPSMLPIQVVNLGKRTAVLGTMQIESENGMIENGTSLVGSLDAGGYFTLDAMVIPEQSGPTTLNITIDYTDDFNQARTITHQLEIEVMEAMEEPILEPGMEGGGEIMPTPVEENTFQKIWRFVLGILGLDSAPPSNNDPGIMPGIQEEPMPAPEPGAGKG
ncbi:MAG TPA: IPT/TIG domain-containing protein [Anaerolineales bacterium]|nr:IPT/TIG domain-containing protein [Anaerolineales bacterium]